MPTKEIVRQIAGRVKRGEVVFFLGAGVSYFSPSDFPSGVEVKNTMIDAVCRRDRFLQGLLTTPYRNDKGFADRLDRLSPERIFEALYEVVAERLTSLFLAFRGGATNPNHRVLAECIRRQWLTTIITTNFDHLIEDAVATVSTARLAVTRSDEDLTRSHEGVTLHKLHGSADAPASVLATLSQTGRYLSPARRDLLTKCLETQTVVFVGYSGYDFDVMTVVCSAQLKEVYWIVRPGSDPFQAPMMSLLKNKPHCTFVHYDLNDWFHHLSLELDLLRPRDEPSRHHHLSQAFQKKVQESAACFPDGQRTLMVAKILALLWEYEKAVVCCERLLEDPGSVGGPVDQARVHLTLGAAHRDMGQLSQSYRHYDSAFKIFEAEQEYYALTLTALDLGWSRELSRQPEIAQVYYMHIAHGFVEYQGDVGSAEPALARALLGWGRARWAQGDTTEGYELTKLARSGAEVSGHVDVLMTARLQLAQMHAAKEEWATAVDHAREALQLAYVLGDCFTVHNASRFLARVYVGAGEPGSGGKVLAQADSYLRLWDFASAVFDRPWFRKVPRVQILVDTLFG